jgi:hypothetical protein
MLARALSTWSKTLSRLSRRTIAASGLTALVAALAFAADVRANAGVQAKCTLGGNWKTPFPMSLVGGKGVYIFDSFILDCVAVESPPVQAVTLSADIRSTGTIKNLICGTLALTSDEAGIDVLSIDVSPDSRVGPAGYAALIGSLKYEIDVVAGEGVLYWHNAVGKTTIPMIRPLDEIDPKPHDEKARYLGGTVSLFPPGTMMGGSSEKPFPEPPPGCTKSFDVFATLEVSDPDVPTPLKR